MPKKPKKIKALPGEANVPNRKSSTPVPKVPHTVAGWIDLLESELRKSGGANADYFLRAIRKNAPAYAIDCWLQKERGSLEEYVGDLPDELTMPEVLQDRLLVVWTDAELWRRLNQLRHHPPQSPIPIDRGVWEYIRRTHHVCIPFPVSVWIELAAESAKGDCVQRGHLFQLMVALAPQFFTPGASGSDLPAGWLEKLSEQKLGRLLRNYLIHPDNDWRPSLQLEWFPEAVVKLLEAATAQLTADLKYISKHPERYDARRAPSVPARTRSLNEARNIEQMASTLRENPGISDYALAKAHFGSFNRNKRSLANEARRLAYFRDQIPVVFYKSRGEKPT